MSCAYCKADGDMVLDHVVPRSRGGPDAPSNLVHSCVSCNSAKSDQLPSEWLTDVPDHVAAIEARVSATVAVATRARRGCRPGERKQKNIRVGCDRCGRTIEPRSDRCHWGWLTWTRAQPEQRDGKRLAYDIRIECVDCHKHRSWVGISDLPIEWVSGHNAIGQCWRLMRDYAWRNSDEERLADLMFELQFLPTSSRDVPRW